MATGKLFPQSFDEGFRAAIKGIQSSVVVNAARNRALEALLEEQTGARVAVKTISSSKQIKNRFSEVRNRPDQPEHVLVLVPAKHLVPTTEKHARIFVALKAGFTSVTIVSTSPEPEAAVIVHRGRMLRGLKKAFPDAETVKI
jgi:hypothetical protein